MLFEKPESQRDLVKGLVLLNCAGGMNNKAVFDDWRIKLLMPLLLLIDFLLKQRGIASALFNRVKDRHVNNSLHCRVTILPFVLLTLKEFNQEF